MNNIKKYILSGIILLLLIPKIACAEYAPPDPNVCNRGIDTPARAGEIFNFSSNAICRYDISSFSSEGWYILQIDGDYKVELSTDRINWTTELTSSGWNYWTNKGAAKSMSPYYIDLKPYLPENVLYVKISDNTPGNGNGARVLNALLLERCYPNFYAGGAEPFLDGLCGDQNFLFEKNNTSDRTVNGRFADGTASFTYKFDLPDDNDGCKLFANVSQQYKVEISKDWDFSQVFYTTQSLNTADTPHKICIDLIPLLSQISDNVIYFRMSDAEPSTGWGGVLREFWITPQISAEKMTFHPYDEIESAFIWENSGSRMAWGNTRYTDLSYFFVYRFNFAYSNSTITINTDGEYLFQGSSNGVDWVDLFIGPSNNTQAQAETLTFNPFTGETIGHGAQSGIPNLVADSFDGRDNVFFLRVADVDPSDGWGAQMKSITVSPSETIAYTFESTLNSGNLSFQPRPDDLAQMPGTTKSIIQGGMHSVTPAPAGFNKFFDSDAVGSFGTDTTYHGCGLLQDGISDLSSDTIILVQFDSPKTIDEVHFFTYWGDDRQFAYFELWGSTTGTADDDYSKLGTALNADYGETNDPPNTMIYRLARLYNPTYGVIADNITSLRIVHKNVGYNIESGEGVMLQPGTSQGSYRAISGSAINEIDIIGIPEPVTIYYLSFIIYHLLKRKRNI